MLTALVLALLALVLLAGLGAVMPGPRGAAAVHGGCGLVALLFAGLGFAALAGGGAPVVALPFGPPWGAALVALDGLSAWFLALLGLAAAAASLAALARAGAAPRPVVVAFPLFLAGMALTLIAADAITLVFGFEAMSLASWAMVAGDHQSEPTRRAARLYLGFAVLGAIALVPAFGLLGAAGGDLAFAALRAAPPEGWRALAVLGLVVAGAGAKAGLFPLHAWLPLAHAAAPTHVSALMSGVMVKVALYVLARVALDLCGQAQPVWWGLPLIVAGSLGALLAALRANLEEDTKVLLACSTIEHVGLIAVALGLAVAFRAADLGALAAVAAAAALLHAFAHAQFKTLLFLAAGEVAHAAATRRLDRLGGLIHGMPLTAALALLGAGSAAGLPPLAGFAGEWLLLQSLFAAWRVGDLLVEVVATAAVALVALAAALGAAAMVRLFGLAFLGRPRSPRAAGAEDGPLPARLALGLCGVGAAAAGLLPGLLLGLAGDALRLLVGEDLAPRAMPLGLGAGDGAALYAPLAVAALLAAAGLGLVWFLRRRSPAGVLRGPAWDCGFAPPPPHLPFGDPATQPSAAGMGQPLRRMLGEEMLAAREVVRMPPPGDPGPARIDAGFDDPSFRHLLAPLDALRERLVGHAERLRDLSIRQGLVLAFATLVALLLLLAGMQA